MKNKLTNRHAIYIIIILAIAFILISITVFGENKSNYSNQITEEIVTEEVTENNLQPIQTMQTDQDKELEEIMDKISNKFYNVEYVEEYKKDENRLNNEINTLERYKEELIRLAESTPKRHKFKIDKIVELKIEHIDSVLNVYYADKEHIDLWNLRSEEYPVATQVWLFMKDQGWSDAVCAGILGNMMTECGGHTLDLQWWLYDYSGWFYGVCQWHKGYYPEVQGQSLEYQLQHLANTMEQEFGMFGSNALNRFLSMTDPASVALDFAKKYERCAATEWNYVSRQNNAWIAYNYFCK